MTSHCRSRIAVTTCAITLAVWLGATVEAQESEVRAVVDAWPILLDSGDVDGLMELFVADLVFAHPQYPGIMGKDSMRVFAERIFQQQSSTESSVL